MPKSAHKKKHSKRTASSVHIKVALVILGMVAVFLSAGVYLSTLKKVCGNSITCAKDLSGVFEPNAKEGVFLGKKIAVPDYLSMLDTPRPVLGEKIGINKRIFIDLTTQRLYAFEDDTQVFTFLVSTGKWGATPTGEFTIWSKLKYTRMSGGNPALGTYYNLPNVPFTMFYYNKDVSKYQGYSIHGAYWHTNFGHPMSHGCINMDIADSEKLFYWAQPTTTAHTTYASDDDPGTKVVVYGKAPNE